jgi:hypothetical protein
MTNLSLFNFILIPSPLTANNSLSITCNSTLNPLQQFSIFKALLEDKLERIILLKRKADLQTKEGFLITHDLEMEVDTKLRDNYRSK